LVARVGVRREPGLVPAFALSLLLGVAVTWGGLRLRSEPELWLDVGAVATPLPGGGVALTAGRVVVHARRELKLETPELEVRVVRGAVAVVAEPGRSLVEVLEGAVEVRREGLQVSLRAGEKVTSEDPRLTSSRLHVAVPQTPGPCEGAGARACLERAAEGDDVQAQTAVLRLALEAIEARAWARAEALSRRSLARFPEGVLAPEVHLALLEALSEQQRDAEARGEAAWYLGHAPDSPSAPQVALLWGDLELRAGRWVPAQEAYARTLRLSPSPALAQEAHLGVGVALLRGGHPAEARAAFERALAVDLEGPRAAELRRRLQAP
jgi:TolA-binding protein